MFGIRTFNQRLDDVHQTLTALDVDIKLRRAEVKYDIDNLIELNHDLAETEARVEKVLSK